MKAIILHNMGGARSERELKEFLINMFKDKRIISSPIRYVLAYLIANLRYKKVWKNYEKIGGSKIYFHTQNLCNKMKQFTDFDVIYAMKYTKPFLKDVIHNYEEVIFIPLYPHYSFTTYESSLDDLKSNNFKGKVTIIKPFFENKKFNELIKNHIISSVPKDYHLILSAHGIPKKLVKKGDIYYEQILKHFEILKTLPFKSVNLAFQSRFGPFEWTKPYLDEELKKYKNQKVAIYPLSFLIDNSETDLELAIEYKDLAKKIGIKEYKVVKCLNEKIAKFLVEIANESYNSKS